MQGNVGEAFAYHREKSWGDFSNEGVYLKPEKTNKLRGNSEKCGGRVGKTHPITHTGKRY